MKRPDLKKLFNNKKRTAIICIILAFVILVSSFFGILLAVVIGERIDCDEQAELYNSHVPDSSHLYGASTDAEITAKIEELDRLLAKEIESVGLDSLLYNDDTATLVAILLGEATSTDFTSIKFKALKKSFPQAYEYIVSQQQAGVSWQDLGTIPFGISLGNKDDFVKACGAMGEFLGEEMLTLVLKAPSAYNDALVPALESLHTGEMPSFFSFVFQTGLSSSARVEFIVEKILTIIEPIKEAPLTYLCTIAPDFITNYRKACSFINSKNLDFKLPEIDNLLTLVFEQLNLIYEPIDLEFLSKLGTAEVASSGANRGRRVEINGDRNAVFLYIADYIVELVHNSNNYPLVEKTITTHIKNLKPEDTLYMLLDYEKTSPIIACIVDIIAMNKAKYDSTDAQTLVDTHNAGLTDLSTVFSGILSQDNLSKVIDTIDSALVNYFAENDIYSIIYTDTIVTALSKFTAELCDKPLSEIPFAALKKSFPEAYDYVSSLQQQGKTWDDVGVIPFGVTPGDREAFIVACGAGAEHFGDTLALCLIVSSTSYEEALMPLLESLHTGAMPGLKDFIAAHGLDVAKRMEIIIDKLLTVLEPLTAAPLTYLCEMLPDFIYSYNRASEFSLNDPYMSLTGLVLPPIEELLGDLLGSFGLILPEYDFNALTALAAASVAESGDRTGKRVELIGNREAVFLSLAKYILSVASFENNMEVVASLAGELGIDPTLIKTAVSWLSSLLNR